MLKKTADVSSVSQRECNAEVWLIWILTRKLDQIYSRIWMIQLQMAYTFGCQLTKASHLLTVKPFSNMCEQEDILSHLKHVIEQIEMQIYGDLCIHMYGPVYGTVA